MVQPLVKLLVVGIIAVLLPIDVRAEAYGSGWYREFQASYGHEDNITRTYESDTISDEIVSISLGGGYLRKYGDKAQLVLSGYLIYNQYRQWNALDHFGVAIGAYYKVQPKLAYNAPWFEFKLNATDFSYDDSEPREGVLVTAEMSADRRLLTALNGHLGYRYKDVVFSGKSSAEKKAHQAFDTDAHEIFLGLDYLVGDSIYLFGEYAYRQGDIRSTVSAAGAKGVTHVYDAETLDTIFDPPCTRRCSKGYAYRQEGDTHLTSLGIAFPVGRVAMDLSVNFSDAKGDNGKSYRNVISKLGLVWNF